MAWINIFEEFQPWLISMHVLCLHLRALSRCPACPAGRNCEPAPSSTRCMKGCSAMAFRLRVRERIQKILMFSSSLIPSATGRIISGRLRGHWKTRCFSFGLPSAFRLMSARRRPRACLPLKIPGRCFAGMRKVLTILTSAGFILRIMQSVRMIAIGFGNDRYR